MPFAGTSSKLVIASTVLPAGAIRLKKMSVGSSSDSLARAKRSSRLDADTFSFRALVTSSF